MTDTWTMARVTVPMRDGVRLGGIRYHADGAARPVLLVRTPYSEPLSRNLPVLPALDAGFSVLVQDCRGTGRSDGEFRTFENERADGVDTLAWLRGQPWCDGTVVMFGQSYLGMVQLAVAGERPDGLAAIATMVTPDDYRDGLAYRQGAFQLGQALAWHLMKSAQALGEGRGTGTQPAELLKLSQDTEAGYRTLPLSDRPGIVLPSWHTWLSEEDSPDYWRGISYAGDTRTVPGLHVGGWFDLFLRGTINNATATPGQHLIVGPWSHVDQTGVFGEVCYPGGAAQAIRLEEQQLRFLRDSVDGVPTSLPPVQIYVMGADRWRTEQEWPLRRTDWQTWHLGADGSLGRAAPAAGVVEFVHDPHDPVPTVGGAILMAVSRPGYQPGSRDQRELDRRRDIVRYTSAVLAEDIEVTGPLAVTLHAATSAADTDFTAKLVDVHPDGRAMGIADGIVRARYRHGMDNPSPVVPGEVYEYTIDLGATSQVFLAGHRIRVDVASSNFPCYDRNPGSGRPAGQVTEADFGAATQRIVSGTVRLPVIPARKG